MTPDVIVIIIQLIFGQIVKRWPNAAVVVKKLIPVFSYILAVLIELGKAIVAHADSLNVVAEVPHSPSFWGKLGMALLHAFINTICSVGIYSGTKNTAQAIRGE